MIQFFASVLVFFAFSTPCLSFGKRSVTSPCPHIRIKNAKDIKLTATEERLLCGDQDNNALAKPWRQIPPAQAKRNFAVFLQDRGYYFPKFKELSSEVLEFDSGPLTAIEEITTEKFPEDVRTNRYRLLIDEPLTPKNLSEIKDWIHKRFLEEGYPCPEIEISAVAENGKILALWKNPTPKAKVSSIIEDQATGLAPGVLRRYDAFFPGDTYSLISTEITVRRSLSERLMVSHTLEPKCMGKKMISEVDLKESANAGLPRFISFSVGANTESLLLGRISWSHTKLGRAGSNFELSSRGSIKEQSVKATGDWYYLKHNSRNHLTPTALFSHEKENRYETLGLRSRALWETGWELSPGSLNFGIGPGWRRYNQLEGLGPRRNEYLTAETELSYLSHLLEYHAQSPRQGERISLNIIYSMTEIHNVGHPLHFNLEGTWLENPGDFEPPLFVFGLRGGFFFTHLPPGTANAQLPVEFRRWIGGGRNLRGFGRNELPNTNLGSRFGIFGGSELRIPHLLPFKLEPFLLVDGALLYTGSTVLGETSSFFWNPGFGLRWESPVGPLRTSLAHGSVPNGTDPALSHWQFYLSLGEEF